MFIPAPACLVSNCRRDGTTSPARAAARHNPAASATILTNSKTLGVDHVFGLSTQDTDYQREAAERLHLPFPILSDAELKFTRALKLPTFSTSGMTLLKRMALVVDDGIISKVFYPVFPPDKNAAEVVAWLRDGQANHSTKYRAGGEIARHEVVEGFELRRELAADRIDRIDRCLG